MNEKVRRNQVEFFLRKIAEHNKEIKSRQDAWDKKYGKAQDEHLKEVRRLEQFIEGYKEKIRELNSGESLFQSPPLQSG